MSRFDELRETTQQYAFVDDPDGRFLATLTDDELEAIGRHGQHAAEKLAHNDQLPDAAWWVLVKVVAVVRDERHRRRRLAENARVELEANGHEVWLSHDGHMFGRDAPGWYPGCWCGWDGGDHGTEAGAAAAAERHRAEHGGAWADETR